MIALHFRSVWLVAILLAGANSPSSWSSPSPVVSAPSASNPSGLHSKLASHGKLYFQLKNDLLPSVEAAAIALAEFGAATPENSMKWDATECFTQSDVLVEWAVGNGKLVRGHTLVWHSQLPSWVTQITDKSTLAEVIENHIAAVAGRYITKWDVCKWFCGEVLTESGSLRNSIFFKVLGEDFITVSFQAARKADSGAVLGGSNGLEKALGIAASAPVKELAITEVDVSNANPADYINVVKACLSEPKCVGVSAWGISNRGRVPLRLRDISYEPRPAYNAIINFL
ncbi:glycoside hydrolase [Coprinellus micaceus]|uniref:Glycoside hydrolase n=1 Tax=Coprinellus micaceus TaxID=71717 RepID=A0A4Y7SYT6_COPMI|nr:glycoside hydrolase [Coprinellus micaceus]